MFVKTYNQNGEETGKALLPKEIFGIKINLDLIHRVVVAQLANRRRIIADTKDRSEVRGGGIKPWRQKGTGRARHGSSRSPIWRHGGVTFGPTKERIFKKVIPEKIRRKVLFMVLSAKANNNLLFLTEELKISEPKTKLMAEIIANLRTKIADFKKGSILIVLPEMNKNVFLSARNLDDLRIIQAKDLNALDLLSFKYLIMPKESIKVIKETFIK